MAGLDAEVGIECLSKRAGEGKALEECARVDRGEREDGGYWPHTQLQGPRNGASEAGHTEAPATSTITTARAS